MSDISPCSTRLHLGTNGLGSALTDRRLQILKSAVLNASNPYTIQPVQAAVLATENQLYVYAGKNQKCNKTWVLCA